MDRRALPFGLRITWFCIALIAILFAARVAWEKTVWTWERGPQAVGFSLFHIHPLFAIVGALCCFSTMLWLLPAVVHAVRRRRDISLLDGVMLALSLFVAVAIILLGTFFATTR